MLVLDGVHDEMGSFRVSGLPLWRPTNAGATKGAVVEVGEAEPHSAPEEEKPGRWGRSLAGFNCSLDRARAWEVLPGVEISPMLF
jgi:hypothetical protein